MTTHTSKKIHVLFITFVAACFVSAHNPTNAMTPERENSNPFLRDILQTHTAPAIRVPEKSSALFDLILYRVFSENNPKYQEPEVKKACLDTLDILLKNVNPNATRNHYPRGTMMPAESLTLLTAAVYGRQPANQELINRLVGCGANLKTTNSHKKTGLQILAQLTDAVILRHGDTTQLPKGVSVVYVEKGDLTTEDWFHGALAAVEAAHTDEHAFLKNTCPDTEEGWNALLATPMKHTIKPAIFKLRHRCNEALARQVVLGLRREQTTSEHNALNTVQAAVKKYPLKKRASQYSAYSAYLKMMRVDDK